MEDGHGLLTGKGKTLRVLPQKVWNEKIVEYYINQAIEINSNR